MIPIEFDFEEKIETKKDKVKRCECCGRPMIIYKRALNSNMCLTLLHLYRHKKWNYIHVEKFLAENNYPRSGDFHKLVYWGFLERKNEERSDGCKYNGYYKITGRGIAFAEGKINAKSHIEIFNNKPLGFVGNDVYIWDCLNKSFNYNELMSQSI